MRSYYFLWLEKHARCVLKAIAPWGLAMFPGDVVVSMNAIHKDIFLTPAAREVVVVQLQNGMHGCCCKKCAGRPCIRTCLDG